LASPTPARITPDAAHRILSRIGYGPRPGEAEALSRQGLPAWVEAQLAMPAAEAPAVAAQLAAIRFPIRYPTLADWPAVDEQRPLTRLNASGAELFALLPGGEIRIPGAEVDRPRVETVVATLIRRAEAPAQLRERLVEFWHDHFSIAGSASNAIMLSVPEHDRRVRAHATGRFRDLLEAMATSPAMLVYLSNQSSRAGAPNENFARELLELHTLGRPAYFGAARTGRDVPRDAAGMPAGYVDADVWEAARAFTGWTLALGQQVDGNNRLPRDGSFTFVAAWSDPYQKRFLGQELEPFAGGMAHGRAILDILAAHPATASFVCTKLVRFLIGEPVPAAVARATVAFRQHAANPSQMAEVVRAILLGGPEVADPALGRMRRPVDALVAGARAYGLTLQPTPPLLLQLAGAGQLPFGWPAPDGQPLDDAAYNGAGTLRSRWAMLSTLPRQARGDAAPLLTGLAGRPVREVAGALAQAALGPTAGTVAETIAGVWTSAGRPDRPGAPDILELAGWVLTAPAFQRC